MPELSGTTYSEIDGSNNQAAPNGMPEGMPPSGVNDAWRAGMGAIKRTYDRDHGGIWATVGGTANAITLTYATGPTSYVQGERYVFKATAANAGATTVNINALGMKNVFQRGVLGVVACGGGEIQSGDIVMLDYDGTQFQIVSQISPVVNFVGQIVMVPATTAPSGYVKANGALLSRTTFANLFAFAQASGNITASDGAWSVSTTPGSFSPGDGSTTFRVPDLRGLHFRAQDDGAGIDPGRVLGSLQGDAMQGHLHANTTNNAKPYAIGGTAGDYLGATLSGSNAGGVGSPITDGANGTPRTAAETRPKNVTLFAFIKF
jgi:microcystin-dependent protein